ncbi:MAG TPA: tRNA (adenosine(37)-N6)-dimethylallyltransferase MiaA [Bacteroidia bacterium]|nr:tRNA (adenosine(37)-N6)-dimethylallyltransferase MiaA [Bacteroidia bacterium]
MQKPLLVVVCGPTGIGKTGISIELAEHFQTCIVSADSRQFYREIPIGTAQPSPGELERVPHFFIASHSIHEPVDAGTYAREVHALLAREFEKRKIVFLTGGSGLFINAVIHGFDELPSQDAELRAALQQTVDENGLGPLLEELESTDPEYFALVDRQNPARVIRAIEVCRLSGKKYSALCSQKERENFFRVVKLGLEMPREKLYERINKRVDEMLEAGLEEEARRVFPFRHLNALQTVGYKELFDYFEGKTSREKAVELIRQHSRNYAKRQMTWWRKDAEIKWFEPGKITEMMEMINEE